MAGLWEKKWKRNKNKSGSGEDVLIKELTNRKRKKIHLKEKLWVSFWRKS